MEKLPMTGKTMCGNIKPQGDSELDSQMQMYQPLKTNAVKHLHVPYRPYKDLFFYSSSSSCPETKINSITF